MTQQEGGRPQGQLNAEQTYDLWCAVVLRVVSTPAAWELVGMQIFQAPA